MNKTKSRTWPKRILSDPRWRPLGRSAVARQLDLNWNSYFDRPKYFRGGKWDQRHCDEKREHQYLTFVVYCRAYPVWPQFCAISPGRVKSAVGRRIMRRPVKGVHSHGKTRKYGKKFSRKKGSNFHYDL